MSSPPHALPPALPPAALLAYAAAHFGKSMLWYIGELLLIFALTEYVGLSSVAAGFSVAAGLLISAAMGVFAARRWRPGANLAWAGRSQWRGIAWAAIVLSLLFLTPLLPPAMRLVCVLLLSLPFRIAYAVGDVAQNTLIGLARWPWRGARGVSALRLIGSGLAALSISAAIGLLLRAGEQTSASIALAFVATVSAIALLSAWWLRQSLQTHVVATTGAPSPAPTLRWQRQRLLPPSVIAALSLALPTFTKLAPYLAQTGRSSPGWSCAVLTGYAAGTILVQPLAARWLTTALRRLGASGVVLTAFGLLFALDAARHAWLDGALAVGMGMAAGTAGQWVWARCAELACSHSAAQQANSIAILTASAQVALAIGSALIGLLLSACDSSDRRHEALAWAMALGPVVCGLLCVLLAWAGSLALPLRRKTPAAAVIIPRRA
ncbi:MFS transporter [Xanthomonas oryzae]|uniref:Membrane protein, putative n=1 Tax=Xanthomonas oryzae pv. oryzicola (strain BLS256) TaxID=383407 RepID=G7TFB4_XANOB|nr:MFS transporter [Xanthomonas oryzae]AEQ95282.1 membrane protein, putative [Xanthomonas oryzae pv. oryzicola BLS256]AKN92478.1 membrane protein [Xanthomonas oryzae pv. oryzicola]AKN96214.1 membrane protein [Xanthomonas oryzae pv. oryzicola]AKO11436.1 membrane protein [Xanthomonas oryzae pv. oryzicola]AKO15175.1 membrane protein [Xanthomonas oryzae pv. oryzicola]